MSPLNRHHLLFERNDWRRERAFWALRTMRGLILPLPIAEIHQPLHKRFDGVPTPTREAARLFVQQIALPYEIGQPMFQTVDQAIGWFDSTGNFGTSDHLAAQREFIVDKLNQERDAA